MKLLLSPLSSQDLSFKTLAFSFSQHAGEVLFDQLFFKCQEFFSKVFVRPGQVLTLTISFCFYAGVATAAQVAPTPND
jgi:hypothetical protein